MHIPGGENPWPTSRLPAGSPVEPRSWACPPSWVIHGNPCINQRKPSGNLKNTVRNGCVITRDLFPHDWISIAFVRPSISAFRPVRPSPAARRRPTPGRSIPEMGFWGGLKTHEIGAPKEMHIPGGENPWPTSGLPAGNPVEPRSWAFPPSWVIHGNQCINQRKPSGNLKNTVRNECIKFSVFDSLSSNFIPKNPEHQHP